MDFEHVISVMLQLLL